METIAALAAIAVFAMSGRTAHASGQAGACCADDGGCQEIMEFECEEGVFLGEGTVCEGDDDGDGIDDACDICPDVPNPDQDPTDCDGNESPDECDLLRGDGADCNDNGRLDSCDIALGAGPGVGGPVLIGGDDADDHGDNDGGVNNRGWLYIEDGLNLLGQNVLNGNTQAVCLGCNDEEASDAFESGFDLSNLPGTGWTRHTITGAADIGDFFAGLGDVNVNTAGIIYMPSDADNVDDGITAEEIAAVNANAGLLNTFVATGGGLFTHTQEDIDGGFGWLTTLLPGLNFFSDGAFGCDDDILNLTPDGMASFPSLTDMIISNATPWHNLFRGDFGGLDVLVTGPCEPDDGQFTAEAVILGGAQVQQLGGSQDLNNNGIPDECEPPPPPPGGGGPVAPFDPSLCTGSTDADGDLVCVVGDGDNDLGQVQITGAGADVDVRVRLTEGEGPAGDAPGPGTGTFSGFSTCEAFGRTLELDVGADAGTFKALLCLTMTAEDIAELQAQCPAFMPEDASIHVLGDDNTWTPAGSNDLGEEPDKPASPTVGDFGYVVDADGNFTYFVCRDQASFYAIGVTAPPEPPAPPPPPPPPGPQPPAPSPPPTPPAPMPEPPPTQTTPESLDPLCVFCGIGCPQMMILSLLGLIMMGFVQRRRRW